MRKTLLGLVLLAASVWVQAQEPVFKEDHPDTYTVVKGDTLWDISGRFLRLPWKWPEIWHANPQISNPHLIYPGDVISLVYIDGQPRLMVNRGNGGTIKLSPQARVKPIAEAIPTIPLEAINSFLRAGRIIEDEAIINNAPYVIGGEAESVVLGAGNKVYARGNFSDNVPAYEFYRRGKTYVNPETGELLGIHLQEIGNGNVAAVEGDIATLNVTRSRQEVLELLLPLVRVSVRCCSCELQSPHCCCARCGGGCAAPTARGATRSRRSRRTSRCRNPRRAGRPPICCNRCAFPMPPNG